MRVWVPEQKRFVKARFDTSRLAPGIWFVRSGKGRGLFPVTPEGQRVMQAYFLVALAGAVIGGVVAYFVPGLWWVAAPVLGIGGGGAWFIMTARRHGDPSVNVMDLIVRES